MCVEGKALWWLSSLSQWLWKMCMAMKNQENYKTKLFRFPPQTVYPHWGLLAVTPKPGFATGGHVSSMLNIVIHQPETKTDIPNNKSQMGMVYGIGFASLYNTWVSQTKFIISEQWSYNWCDRLAGSLVCDGSPPLWVGLQWLSMTISPTEWGKHGI